MSAMASQIISLTILYSTVYSGTDQGKHQRSASLAFVREIHRSPVNSPHKGPVTRIFFYDVIIYRCFSSVAVDVYFFVMPSKRQNIFLSNISRESEHIDLS